MKRNELLSKISDMLLLIGRSIEQLGSMNLNNDAVLAENTFKDLLNVIYKASFVNANSIKHNMPGIDLIDLDRKILFKFQKNVLGVKSKNLWIKFLKIILMVTVFGFCQFQSRQRDCEVLSIVRQSG